MGVKCNMTSSLNHILLNSDQVEERFVFIDIL